MKYKRLKRNGRPIDEHRFVMEQFLGRKLGRYEVVHHKNGDGLDNRLENLEMQTLSDHSRQHMLGNVIPNNRQFGEQNGQARLTLFEVAAIKKELGTNETISSIAAKHGVSRRTIRRIRDGECWQYV